MIRHLRRGRPLGAVLILAAAAGLAVVKTVPVAGPIAAAPLDATADAID